MKDGDKGAAVLRYNSNMVCVLFVCLFIESMITQSLVLLQFFRQGVFYRLLSILMYLSSSVATMNNVPFCVYYLGQMWSPDLSCNPKTLLRDIQLYRRIIFTISFVTIHSVSITSLLSVLNFCSRGFLAWINLYLVSSVGFRSYQPVRFYSFCL